MGKIPKDLGLAKNITHFSICFDAPLHLNLHQQYHNHLSLLIDLLPQMTSLHTFHFLISYITPEIIEKLDLLQNQLSKMQIKEYFFRIDRHYFKTDESLTDVQTIIAQLTSIQSLERLYLNIYSLKDAKDLKILFTGFPDLKLLDLTIISNGTGYNFTCPFEDIVHMKSLEKLSIFMPNQETTKILNRIPKLKSIKEIYIGNRRDVQRKLTIADYKKLHK